MDRHYAVTRGLVAGHKFLHNDDARHEALPQVGRFWSKRLAWRDPRRLLNPWRLCSMYFPPNRVGMLRRSVTPTWLPSRLYWTADRRRHRVQARPFPQHEYQRCRHQQRNTREKEAAMKASGLLVDRTHRVWTNKAANVSERVDQRNSNSRCRSG